MKSRLSLIAAMTASRVIGVNNHLPWNIPEDLRQFKKITLGHPIVMGRKTFESIGKVLPKRTNIIVSRTAGFRVEGAMVCRTVEEALTWAARAPGGEEIFVIGGAELFKLALPMAWRIYLTEIQWPFEGDTFFPEFSESDFKEISRETIARSPEAVLRVLERNKPELAWE